MLNAFRLSFQIIKCHLLILDALISKYFIIECQRELFEIMSYDSSRNIWNYNKFKMLWRKSIKYIVKCKQVFIKYSL